MSDSDIPENIAVKITQTLDFILTRMQSNAFQIVHI
jgi:hypothetical protein